MREGGERERERLRGNKQNKNRKNIDQTDSNGFMIEMAAAAFPSKYAFG